MTEVLFWLSLVPVVHTYLLYPVVVSLMKSKGAPGDPGATGTLPPVSVVIAAHNEEAWVRDRIDNVFSGSYPGDRLEVLVGSDGSTDGTNVILTSCARTGFRPFVFPVRRGKAAVLNDLLREARGEIVVFTDANTSFFPETIGELVRPFSDRSVGAVCGELTLHSGSGGDVEASYWRFENWLKRAESEAGTTLGASGGVYAIRRELWRPLPFEKSIVDDFLIPMNVLKSGKVVRYNARALASERSTGTVRGEFERKVRIGASNFNGIPEFAELLHPRRGFVAFALWSHKIFRWFVPFFLIAAVVLAAGLRGSSAVYDVVIAGSAAFGALAAVGFLAEKLGRGLGVLGYPYYFLAMNFALLLGFFKSITGRQRPVWEVVR